MSGPTGAAEAPRGASSLAFVLGKGRNALAAVRSLGRHGVAVTLVNDDPADAARASRFCAAETSPSPAGSPEAFVEFLLALAPRRGPPPVLMPTGDLEVMAVSEQRDRLAGRFALSIADLGLVRALVLKDAFAELAARHGLRVPRTWAVRNRDGLEAALAEVPFPCVVKPAYSPAWRRVHFGDRLPADQHGRMKRLVVRSPEELRAAYAEAACGDPAAVIQEQIPGADDALYDVYAYLDAGGTVRGTYVIRKRRTWPVDGNGGGSCVESTWDATLERTAVRFLRAVGYRGNAAVCFKRSARDGQFYVIEVNARLALHHALAARDGVDLPWMAYLDAAGQPVPSAVRRTTGARWVAFPEDAWAFHAYWARRALGLGQWLASLRGPRVGAHFAPDDPRPGILYAGHRFPRLAHAHDAAARLGDGLRSVVGRGLWASGLVAWMRHRRTRGRASPLILRYHSIGGDRWLRPPLVISPTRFEAQVRYLSRRYRVLPLDEIVDALEARWPVPRAVAITFDDGYRDNHDTAWPILRWYGCPATIFVIVEPLETGLVPWPQRLFASLQATQRQSVECVLPALGDVGTARCRLDLSSPTAREASYRVLKSRLGGLSREVREEALTGVSRALGADPAAAPSECGGMLRWGEVRELAASGLTIGSHTMTHPRLGTLHPEDVAWELRASRCALEAGLGRPVRLLAYPFGKPADISDATRQAARASGYRAAVTTLEGVNPGDVDPFLLQRIKVRDEPIWRFAIRLLAAQNQKHSHFLDWVLGDACRSEPTPPAR